MLAFLMRRHILHGRWDGQTARRNYGDFNCENQLAIATDFESSIMEPIHPGYV